MQRPPKPPERDSLPEQEREQYDLVVARQQSLWRDAPRNSDTYFGALLNSPTVASTFAELGKTMRSGELRGTYSDADRELVDMVLSIDFDYRAILLLHIPDAIAVGVRLEAIEALWQHREDELTDDEKLLTRYIRAVRTGTVDDALFSEIVARRDVRTAVEYSAFITFLIMTMRLWQALGVPDPPPQEIDKLLSSYRSGTGPQLDPQARIG